MTVIVWFRRDLRLADNPALAAAAETGRSVIPLFVLDDEGALSPGGAQRWWLHHSLASLAKDLARAGSPLVLRKGPPREIIESTAAEFKATSVYWNRRYDPDGRSDDSALKDALKAKGVEARSFNGAVLREPWETTTQSGGWYKVFSPFWRAALAAGPSRASVLPPPSKLKSPSPSPKSDELGEWRLRPVSPDWAAGWTDLWTPGEHGAREALEAFLERAAANYAEERNRPDKAGTSRLSPHLALGEISPLQILRSTEAAVEAGRVPRAQAEKFLSEVGWREFSYNLLFHAPSLRTDPMRTEFLAFPWRRDEDGFTAWTRGMTGYPIVDAGMRELWSTGWMHNRVRMIVASFLVKNMMIDWREGERWFWDTLVDADPANNAASWQWVAGCGADAAPYFRIFNPVSQGEKFDPDGDYVRRFVPELAGLSPKWIHRPFDAPSGVLSGAGVKLGENYPRPILDLGTTRERALAAFKGLKAA